MKSNPKYTAFVIASVLLGGLVTALVYFKTPSGNAHAQMLANQMGISDKHLCVFLPDQAKAFDTLDLETFQYWNDSLRYIVNPQNLSIVEKSEETSLRQRFIPSEEGSERVIAVFAVEERNTYELTQSIFFEQGFDWGQIAQSGKFGFGFGGGSAPTGGSTDKDGFTARLSWRGQDDGTAKANLYLYSSDRTLNLPFGDEIEIPNFTIPIGEWFDVTIRLTVNSEHEKADGAISVSMNDELLLERGNIQWQTEGDLPVIDRIIYSTFHGGNTTEWSPGKIVHAQFANACLYD